MDARLVGQALESSTGKPVLNQDLWKEVIESAKPHRLAGSGQRSCGNVYNTRVDVLVHQARRNI
jgi:ribonuclease HI